MRLRASGPQFVSGRSGFKALGVGFKVLGFEGLWVWGFRAWALECRFFFFGRGAWGVWGLRARVDGVALSEFGVWGPISSKMLED